MKNVSWGKVVEMFTNHKSIVIKNRRAPPSAPLTINQQDMWFLSFNQDWQRRGWGNVTTGTMGDFEFIDKGVDED